MRKNHMFTLMLVTLLLLPEVGFAQVVYDNFNNASRARWNVLADGLGPDSEETNRRLEIVLPADSIESPVSLFGGFSVSYLSVCRLQGDFDIRGSYPLFGFPAL